MYVCIHADDMFACIQLLVLKPDVTDNGLVWNVTTKHFSKFDINGKELKELIQEGV